MKPVDKSKLPDDIDEKMRFVFEQAEKGLASRISAYDAIANKAYILLCFLVPMITIITGFGIINASQSPALLAPVIVYVFFLLWAGWYAWKVVQSRDFVHPGRNPFSFGPDDIRTPFYKLYRDESVRYQEAMDSAHVHNENCATWLAEAMRLFIAGSVLTILILLAVAPLLQPV
jgi:hypothetical protein